MAKPEKETVRLSSHAACWEYIKDASVGKTTVVGRGIRRRESSHSGVALYGEGALQPKQLLVHNTFKNIETLSSVVFLGWITSCCSGKSRNKNCRP